MSYTQRTIDTMAIDKFTFIKILVAVKAVVFTAITAVFGDSTTEHALPLNVLITMLVAISLSSTKFL